MRGFIFLVLVLLGARWTHAAPPNIVMLIGDDQGFADYGFLRHPHIQTPHLDQLARTGLTFTHGYVPSSLCRPSLASMITGLYPHEHKITSNDPPLPPGLALGQANQHAGFLAQRQAMVAYIDQVPTLPRWLAPLGYRSYQAGKWWEGHHCRCGFTDGMTHGDPAKGGRHGDAGLTIGRDGLEPVQKFIAQAAKDRIPFYLWYAPMMPHTPHKPPAALFAKYEKLTPSPFVARYWAMCEWFDQTCGAVLTQLDELGLADNTIVVYLHDNGWIQDPNKEQYAPRSKRSPYDGGLRTPILVRWPGHTAPATNATPVSSLDLVPTLLTAAGVKVPANLPGRNLLDAAAVQARPALFGAIFEHNAVDIHQPAANLQYRWIVADGWKLIVPDRQRVPQVDLELFEVRVDPTEQTNRAAEQAERVARLRQQLDAWWPGRPHN